jgi:peptidoglycan/LPS O-acetylase OafA/YrhL
MGGGTMRSMNRFLVVGILLLAFIGISNSSYLATRVTGSYLAPYGLAFFIALFILAAIDIRHNLRTVRRLIQMLSAIGLIASAYITFIQSSLATQFCMYCALSAALALVIFIEAYFIEPISDKRQEVLPRDAFRTKLTMPPSLS